MKIKIVFIALIATVMTLCLTGCINPAASNPAHGNQGNGEGNSENTIHYIHLKEAAGMVILIQILLTLMEIL